MIDQTFFCRSSSCSLLKRLGSDCVEFSSICWFTMNLLIGFFGVPRSAIVITTWSSFLLLIVIAMVLNPWSSKGRIFYGRCGIL